MLSYIVDLFSFLIVLSAFISAACFQSVLRGLVSSKITVSNHSVVLTRSFLLPKSTGTPVNERESVVKRISRQKERIGKVSLISDRQYLEIGIEKNEDVLEYLVQLIKYRAQKRR